MDTQLYNSPQRGVRSGRIAVGYKTDKGRKRSNNEDSYAVFTGEELNARLDGLFVVADGMGGTKGGEIASNIVVNSLPEAVQNLLTEHHADSPPQEFAALLNDSIQRANADVWKYKQQHVGLEKMGTTCVAALISHARKQDDPEKGVLVLANVGDSRAYLLRQGRLSQMSEDHSVVWEEVKAGRMTPEQAAASRFRNEITRHIGQGPAVKPDITIRELMEGDVILLCSDGLTTEVDDQTVARLLASHADPQDACNRLVEAALTNGGSDNVTVVVLHYGTFIPIVAASPSDALSDEDEEITDPNQAWKRSLSASRVSSREDVEREDRYAPTSRGGYGLETVAPRRGVSLLLFGLLLLTAMAEAVGLYLLWAGQIKPRPIATPPQVPTIKPTDKPLTYQKPVLLYGKLPLWEGVLQVTPDNKLLVAAVSGEEILVTTGGTATPLPNALIKSQPLTQPKVRADLSVKPVPILPAIAFDASGNRYELNPDTSAIDKYDANGVILLPAIAKGAFRSPANLAVDKSGNIYVIDNHQLKKIPAVPDTGQTAVPITTPPQSELSNAPPVKKNAPTVGPSNE